MSSDEKLTFLGPHFDLPWGPKHVRGLLHTVPGTNEQIDLDHSDYATLQHKDNIDIFKLARSCRLL